VCGPLLCTGRLYVLQVTASVPGRESAGSASSARLGLGVFCSALIAPALVLGFADTSSERGRDERSARYEQQSARQREALCGTVRLSQSAITCDSQTHRNSLNFGVVVVFLAGSLFLRVSVAAVVVAGEPPRPPTTNCSQPHTHTILHHSIMICPEVKSQSVCQTHLSAT